MSYPGNWHGIEFEDTALAIVDKELSKEVCNPDVEETAVTVKEISVTEEKNPALDYNSKDARKAKLHVLCESRESDLRLAQRFPAPQSNFLGECIPEPSMH